MNAKDAIRTSLRIADFMMENYLTDITPPELMIRSAPNANHLAWQLGHLISAEYRLVDAAAPGSMPALPPGFAERHT
ncbi:MAG TPA: DinB family protein, partial [Lacipirellulaceae bacterium]|nr:DinB family protein [Lacipirellulaceae bacterium]